MIFDYVTLKLIWLLLIGFLWIAFAVTGGFDLGVAVLLPFLGKTDDERRVILNSIGPTWEGNQVWLITAAGAIFAAWPMVYATFFSSLYFALLILLFALILRPPGIDYRSKLPSLAWRQFWDWSLFVSGFVPLLLFGVAFGHLFLGLPFYFDDTLRSFYTGDFLSLLRPFPLLTGVMGLSLLSMHGALFLQLKTPSTSAIQKRAIFSARLFGMLFFICFLAAFFWIIKVLPGYRLVSIPDINTSFSPLVKQVSVATGAWMNNFERFPTGWLAPLFVFLGVIFALFFSAFRKAGYAMIFSAAAICAVIVTGGFILFPFILPSSSIPNHSLTIWDACSSYLTLSWMFWAVMILCPIVISYTIWVYRVMRGKVEDSTHLKSSEYY